MPSPARGTNTPEASFGLSYRPKSLVFCNVILSDLRLQANPMDWHWEIILTRSPGSFIGVVHLLQQEIDSYLGICEDAFKTASEATHVRNMDWLDSPWEGFFSTRNPKVIDPTGVDESVLNHIATVFSSEPQDVVLHRGMFVSLQFLSRSSESCRVSIGISSSYV